MSTTEKISVALTSEMAAMIREAVEGGGYASASEVIRDALRDWKYKNELRERKIEDIRKLWQEGIDSGISTDGELFFNELRSHYKK